MSNLLTIPFAADTDSYKYSHPEQLPESLRYASSYGEARSDSEYRVSVFNGLQAQTVNMVNNPLTVGEVEEARDIAVAHSGEFPFEAMMRIATVHKGLPPVTIQALPEGTVVPNRIPYYQVTNHDSSMPWLGQFMEDQLLRAVWYPTAVATLGWHIKQDMREFLERTCDNPEEAIKFMLHDFGARGASSVETAARGGFAHLINFYGTDTIPALYAAKRLYNSTNVAWSIPAMEHFTVTAWGRENEALAYANMIDKFGGEGKKYACVSDAYDIFNAVDNIWGKQLKAKVLEKGGTAVIRPDSGDPTSIVLYCLKSLAKSYGYTTNSKGFAVLHPSVRIIQGDGVNRDSIISILRAMELNGFSAENVAFGMGGALLQATNRDVLGHAQKASAITSGHTGWIGIAKDPVTARQKVSKKGRLAVVKSEENLFECIQENALTVRQVNQLRDVYNMGKLSNLQTLDDLRANADSIRGIASRFAVPYKHDTATLVV